MKYIGDYKEDYATLNFKFSTHKADGTPITLAGTPAVSVYKANSTDQSTAGVTLTPDFDSVTGLHNVLIDLSSDAFYAVGNDYAVVITAGTVDSVSVVGTVLATFSIENRNIKADLVSILGTALTETSGQIAAAFKKFFDKATPTGTINSLPDAVAGANGGLPTTNGTKINQTVDLTAGQSIACSDKTGFSLSSTGADLILKNSTFIQAIVAAINEFATYGLTALNTLLVTTGIKTATTAPPADMALNSTVAKDATVAKEATLGTIAGYIDTEIADIKAKTDLIPASPATEGKQDTIIGYLDTEIAAILEDTNELQGELAKVPKSDGSVSFNATALAAIKTALEAAGSHLALIKAKTDQIVFTIANQIDANALSGVGECSAPTVEEIRAEIDANSTQLIDILAAIALLSSGVGTGPTPKTYIVTVDGLPCADVLVTMSTDEAGVNLIHSGRTNALGEIIFYPDLPVGTTVYLWRYKTGVTFVNPDEEQI